MKRSLIGTKSALPFLPKTGQKAPDSPFYHKDFLERQAQEELGEEAQENADEE
jgi:hypothetical protein